MGYLHWTTLWAISTGLHCGLSPLDYIVGYLHWTTLWAISTGLHCILNKLLTSLTLADLIVSGSITSICSERGGVRGGSGSHTKH